MAEVATEPAWLEERRQRGASLAESLPLPDQKSKGWEFTDLSGLDLDSYEAGRRRRRDRAAPRARPSSRWPRRSTPTRSCCDERLGSLVADRGPLRRPQRGGLARRRAGPRARAACRLTSRSGSRSRSTRDGARAQLAHPDRARGGRRSRGLGALVLARRRGRRAAQLGGRAERRPGGDAALRQHPGHLREGLDLRHPARPGRARRPPRLGRARLRLGPRQGADGDQARRPRLRGAGHRRLRRRPRPAPRLRHHPGARGAEHQLRPRLPRRPRRRLDRGLARDDQGRPRRPADRRLPGEPQPAALAPRPTPTRSPASRSSPTTSAAPTPRRSPRSTRTSSST